MKSFQFARSAKAARKTRRRRSLNLTPNWGEIELEQRQLLATVTWDGGAGSPALLVQTLRIILNGYGYLSSEVNGV